VVALSAGVVAAVSAHRNPLLPYSGPVNARMIAGDSEYRLLEADIPVANTTDKSLFICGAVSGCGVRVISASRFPVRVGPGGCSRLTVRVVIPANRSMARAALAVFVGSDTLRRVIVPALLRLDVSPPRNTASPGDSRSGRV